MSPTPPHPTPVHALTPFSGGPPASDPCLTAYGKVVGRGWQADGPDVLTEGDVGVQLHQSDVIVVGEGVVIVVGDDLPHPATHRPLVGLALHVQPKKRLPLVSLGVPASTRSSVFAPPSPAPGRHPH